MKQTFSVLLLLVLSPVLVHAQDTINVVIDYAHPKGTISNMLTGSHFVYALENDKLYEDGRIKEWMQAADVNIIRWPGGTAVQHYHWDDLNGIPFKHDSWDPAYDQPYKDQKDFMDLDEYIAFCKEVGATPMVGVNIRSGMKFGKDSLGLQEAKNLVQYCVDKAYHVPYWYIGNEGYASGFGPLKYAKYLDMYAAALKSVDPSITIIGDWKFGPIRKSRFLESIKVIQNSAHIDIMEYHEKWGVVWGLASGITYKEWKNQFPIYDGKLTSYILRFHELMDEIGRPEVQIAFNEWGLGNVEGADEFGHALIAADYLIELFKNEVAQACYWNLNMGSRISRVLNTRPDRKKLIKLNPISKVFELLSAAQGQHLLHVETTEKDIYGFACSDGAGTTSLYLLNKSDHHRKIKTDAKLKHKAVALAAFGSAGEISNIQITDLDQLVLKPWTLNKITLR